MMNRRSKRSKPAQTKTADAAHRQPMEMLEKRVLLAVGDTYTIIAPHGGWTPTSADLADARNGPMATAGPQLISVYREYRRFRSAGGRDADFESFWDETIVFKGAKVGVTVRGRTGLENLTTRLRDAGAEIIARNRVYTVIDAFVPIGQIRGLAEDPTIVHVNPILRAFTKQQGTSNNQADLVQKTDQVRADYGLDGSGITVGVISDSVNLFGNRLAGSYATSDLPMAEVRVLRDLDLTTGQPASDEGRAMLELIHDIAPGADLQFSTFGVTQLTFADAVRSLRFAGSDVIVDDIGIASEPFFQPGVLDVAISDVVSSGAVYLSAAGNDRDAGFEAPITWTRIGRDRYVDFNPGSAVDTRMRVNFVGFGSSLFTFQWDNPYNGVVGTTTSDLDIYWYDTRNGRLLFNTSTNNIKTGIPLEFVSVPDGEFDIEIRLADHVEGAPLPTRYKFVTRHETIEVEYPSPGFRASVFGHSAWRDTISVGAVPFYFPAENESFSAFGPATQIFDAAGTRLDTPRTLQKPDISGVDDVNTSFFGSDSFLDDDVLPNFAGTSAAAPNVAALVALMLESRPSATQTEILDALKSTALPLNGAGPGWDRQGGFGLVDGIGAVTDFVTPPTVDIVDVTPDPRLTAVETVRIVFSQRIVGLDISDLTLTRDGGPNLLTGAQTLTTSDEGRTWILRNILELTSPNGTYTLSLIAPGSGITNLNATPQGLSNSASDTWTKIAEPPFPTTPSGLAAKVIGAGVVRLRWSDNSNNEDRFIIERADDVNFSQNVKRFQVSANVREYVDEGISPLGRRVFYRVRAVNNFSGFAGTSNVVEVFLPGAGEIILGNESSSGVQINGIWETTTENPGFTGDNYLTDLNEGKGAKNVRFTPNITQAGEYFVYARWVRAAENATNVPYDIYFANGRKQTIIIDQRNTGGDGWVLLGKFRFELGRNGFVRIHNGGTNGTVTVDSVRFQPTQGAS